MHSDDPFSSPKADDRTVIKPVPGGKRADLRRQQPARSAPTSTAGPVLRLGRLNPLEHAASGLLALLTRINSARAHRDPASLKKQITSEIKHFQTSAMATGIDQKQVFTARYVLCTVLDEAVLNTPWGHSGGWAQNSLLVNFHQEAAGGERFFTLLKSLGQNPAKNADLLELMYLCLALGFQGRYRLVQGGKDKLVRIREWLSQLISTARGQREAALSPNWQGVTDQRNPLIRFVPLWVFAAIAAAMIATLFTTYLFRLNSQSDQVFNQLMSVQVTSATIQPTVTSPIASPPPIVVQAAPSITLSQLLATEILQKTVNVQESNQRAKVTLAGDGLFRSGSAAIKPNIVSLLHKVGASLNPLNGHILITGHSDNIPTGRTSRYPSNWALSKARAEAVAKLIQQNLDDPGRISVEGLADTQPVDTGNTQQSRAKNRRVEILLVK